uniref:IlGF domain-containing protein n=1 Tax=Caenorhabditis tropicalis TaxID=1561998 RepID=A0A1I7UA64_9PELO
MNTSVILIMMGTCLVVAVSASFHKTQNTDQLLKEIEYDLEFEDAVRKLSRARRVPESKVRSCGRKLVLYVLTVCETSCDPSMFNELKNIQTVKLDFFFSEKGKEVSILCCNEKCSEETIKQYCCPDL